MAEERAPSALEKPANGAPTIAPAAPGALDKKAAELAASITARTRARPPVKRIDFTVLEQSKLGLKGVFLCFFLLNTVIIGGFTYADKHYRFSPLHESNNWEPMAKTKERFRKLREEREKEMRLLELEKELKIREIERRRQRQEK